MSKIYFCEGQCIVHDPGPEMIPFLKAVSSGFRVESIQPGQGFSPRFKKLAKESVALNKPLFELYHEELRTVFFRKQSIPNNANGEYKYSRLKILHALSLSEMSHCRLCGWECDINRFSGERGKCGLGNQGFASNPFIHIAEESVINPSLVTNFSGCALRCMYCIDSQVWNPGNFALLDTKSFWEGVQKHMIGGTPINTLEFSNPTESLPGIIGILSSAPASFNLPLVMNCHLYGSKTFYELASPITDVWLPDLRYGNDQCAKELSGVDNYMSHAVLGLDKMCEQEGRVIVRILVLPGHIRCCHEPAIEILSKYKDRVWVSILDQYVPENEAYLDPNLKRRPTRNEIEEVQSLATRCGLRDISVDSQKFWRS